MTGGPHSGNDGWAFADVLPYFRKSENFEAGEGPLHGQGGELNVAAQRSPHPLSRAFVEAALQCQFAFNADFNGPTPGRLWPLSRHPEKRRTLEHVAGISASGAVASESSCRSGCHRARRCVRRPSRRTAYGCGVAVRIYTVQARREVILSAGAIASPQLLMLSGIGPAGPSARSRRHGAARQPGRGIELAGPLRRGDRCRRAVRHRAMRCLPARTCPADGSAAAISAQARSAFLDHGGSGWLRCGHGPTPSGPICTSSSRRCFTTGQNICRAGTASWCTSACSGRKAAAASDFARPSPADAPSLQPDLLSHDDDRRLLVTGLRIARRIIAAPALAPFRAGRTLPGPDRRQRRCSLRNSCAAPSRPSFTR